MGARYEITYYAGLWCRMQLLPGKRDFVGLVGCCSFPPPNPYYFLSHRRTLQL